MAEDGLNAPTFGFYNVVRAAMGNAGNDSCLERFHIDW